MRKLRNLLHDSIPWDEVLKTADAQRVLRRWNEVVGEPLAKKSTPTRYERGVVWVACLGSAWAQELRMFKPQIMKKLSELADDPTMFKDIRFGVRPLEFKTPYEPPVERPKPDPMLRAMSISEIKERRLANWPEEDQGAT